MILRYTLVERIFHWIAALTYIYLLVTGLALYWPGFYWMASVLGGGSVIRFWHPIAGLAFTATLVWMYVAWRADMRFTAADKAWSRAVTRYVRNEDDNLPPVDRFNAGQKQFFWGMFWAGLALLVSGFVLWYTEYIPWNLRAIRYASVLIHEAAFLITAAGFIVHVYMGTAVVRGGFGSVIRGEVTTGWAQRHHALWFARKK